MRDLSLGFKVAMAFGRMALRRVIDFDTPSSDIPKDLQHDLACMHCLGCSASMLDVFAPRHQSSRRDVFQLEATKFCCEVPVGSDAVK